MSYHRHGWVMTGVLYEGEGEFTVRGACSCGAKREFRIKVD